MIRLLKNRYALSTVITTLIILVVSILLASVLTYFATNVVSTRVQEENLYVSKQHTWVSQAGVAQGGVMITNNGGRDVVINKLTVRGQTMDWANVFSLKVTINDTGLNLDLPYLSPAPADTGVVTGFDDALAATDGNIILPSGNTIVIYFNSPDSIGLNDIGLTASIAVHTSQAVYYSEMNIQAAPS
jgi:heme/copper-type cytochrome/quinol oxidase subunit 2